MKNRAIQSRIKKLVCRFSLLLAVAIFPGSSVSAQSPAPEDIIAASIKAIGGQASVNRIRSIYAFASCRGPRGAYTTEIQSARGNRLMFKQVRVGGNTFIGYVNGETAWTVDSRKQEFSLLDKTGAWMIRGHEFQMIPLALGERYKNFSVEGKENFAGASCIKIRAVDELNLTTYLFFNWQTKLLAGVISPNPASDKGEVITVVYKEWRTVGKVKIPGKVRATDSTGDFLLDFHTIRLNTVDNKIFAIPATVTAQVELMQMHEQARKAHFGKDAKLMVSMFADDHINISAGKINRPIREDIIKRIQGYFDQVEFIEWDDMEPPIIRVAKDASMAYKIVKKRVRLKTQNEQGQTVEETTIFAWMETYEKANGKWILKAVASTNEPPSFELFKANRDPAMEAIQSYQENQ
ncbi:MAG: hypothetical protein AB1757_12755 [Acidobacteriota bacterium]